MLHSHSLQLHWPSWTDGMQCRAAHLQAGAVCVPQLCGVVLAARRHQAVKCAGGAVDQGGVALELCHARARQRPHLCEW